MKILIGGASSKFFHLKEFADALTKFDVEYKLVNDTEISDGYPSRKISNWFSNSNKFKKLINDFKPDVIGISAVSEQYYKANELAEKMKRITNVPLILGGTHITAIPSQLLNSTFKIGVIGEGERTFLEFINMYKKEKSISDENHNCF